MKLRLDSTARIAEPVSGQMAGEMWHRTNPQPELGPELRVEFRPEILPEFRTEFRPEFRTGFQN